MIKKKKKQQVIKGGQQEEFGDTDPRFSATGGSELVPGMDNPMGMFGNPLVNAILQLLMRKKGSPAF